MATMVSTIANGGTYVYPRVVKEIINSQTGETTKIEPKYGERVISKDTSSKVLSMMQSVVAEGTGKNAQVLGYSIGGKTGTSEDGVNTGKYVASFVGVAPIEEPTVVILVTLYNPTGEGGHGGGGVAAPIAGQILSEVLPYLEVKNNNEEIESIETPNVVGLTLKEAKKILEEAGLVMEVKSTLENEELENTQESSEEIIKEQLPKAKIKINKGTNVICYK